MLRELRACYGLLFLLLLLCGLAYPFACLGLGQVFFYANAQGSLLGDKGKLLGSGLIGQNFERADYFHGRPSSAGNSGYDAAQSGASNLGPTNGKLRGTVAKRIATWRETGIQSPIPPDLVTGSSSGLDPEISPASAYFQAETIAAARNIKIRRINDLIESLTTPRDLGFLGEPRINVLALNRALNDLAADIAAPDAAEPVSTVTQPNPATNSSIAPTYGKP
ncbi:MAG: potassium-transporting ATPase subunit KdpC [Bdellovibrionales bacterium]